MIWYWADPRLSQECEEIDDINDDVRREDGWLCSKLCMLPTALVLLTLRVGYMVPHGKVIDADYPGQEPAAH